MNNDIKEINLSEMLFNRDERLLDYITNLQEDLESISFLCEIKDQIINNQDKVINKAIDYINKYCEDYVIEDSPDEMCLFYREDGRYKPEAKEELLNILQGSDKE